MKIRALAAVPMLVAAFLSVDAIGAEITVQLEGTVTESTPNSLTLGEMGSGSLIYDDVFVVPTGTSTISTGSGLVAFDFTIFGQTFVASDDIDFDVLPEFGFADGVLRSIDFVVSEVSLNPGDNPTEIADPRVLLFGFNSDLAESSGVFSGDVVVFEAVPIPATFALLGFGLAGIAVTRKKKADGRETVGIPN